MKDSYRQGREPCLPPIHSFPLLIVLSSSLRPLRAQREVKRRVAHVRPSRGLSPPAKKRQVATEPQFELVSPVVGH